jgi:predicted Zn-dependent peptidase
MQTDISTLPNGITILTTPMASVRSVSVVLDFRIGARYERDAQAGICHFIEHMLFKGTRRFPSARAVSEAVENVGGDLNGGTGKETTDYSVKISADHLDRAFDVLAELVRAPLFEPGEVEKERRVILEELHMYRDSPQDWVHVMLDELCFPGMPLGREVVGSRTTVSSLARDELVAFFTSAYVPANLIISVAGAVDPSAALDRAATLFGDWQAAPPPAFAPCTPPLDGPRAAVSRRAIEQANLCLAVPALGYNDPAAPALSLLSALLGEGMSSRLFQTIREDRGLTYDINSSISSFTETGILEITVGCEPERADAVIAGVLDELRRLSDEMPAAAEVRRVKDYFQGKLVIGLEDTLSVAAWRGGQMALRRRLRSFEEIAAEVEAVTPEDIQRVAQRLFRTPALRLAAIGPLPPEDHFLPLLTVGD